MQRDATRQGEAPNQPAFPSAWSQTAFAKQTAHAHKNKPKFKPNSVELEPQYYHVAAHDEEERFQKRHENFLFSWRVAHLCSGRTDVCLFPSSSSFPFFHRFLLDGGRTAQGTD